MYAKLTFVLLSLSIITVVLYYGQNILIPILLSLFFAILLRPVAVFLNVRLRFPNVIAVFVSVTMFVVFVLAIIVFVWWQVADMTDDWNKIKYNLSDHFDHFQRWIKQRFHVSYTRQESYIHTVRDETLKGESELMGNTLSTFTDTIINVILIPVYTFLILLYRNLFVKFLHKAVKEKNQPLLQTILVQVKIVVQSYIVGLLIEMGMVATLTTVGFMLFGIQYAILLGAITAILNLIPYIGILTAAIIAIIVTLGNSNDISLIIGILVVNVIVHLIDTNFIVPKIVGNKVSINALATIVGVISGGALGGIPGMILSIPLMAIVKIIFDHIEPFKPWGFLLGNSVPDKFELPLIKKVIDKLN
ncbi:MAG TPA: AI-2E family transporter [Bacteroidia bacterium]|nr:AI-2E family transporter [Bacteroidia bacterium]